LKENLSEETSFDMHDCLVHVFTVSEYPLTDSALKKNKNNQNEKQKQRNQFSLIYCRVTLHETTVHVESRVCTTSTWRNRWRKWWQFQIFIILLQFLQRTDQIGFQSFAIGWTFWHQHTLYKKEYQIIKTQNLLSFRQKSKVGDRTVWRGENQKTRLDFLRGKTKK
jgi:hypothetical protein